jgi:transcriptional regulator GlxA family with amidase domain
MLSAALLAALVSVAPAAPASAPGERSTLQVAVVLYPGVELLDFAGPGEVLQVAGGMAASRGVRATRVFTVATTKQPIVSQGFVRVVPEFSVEDAPRPDLLVIPGGSSNRLTEDERFLRWLDEVKGSATTLTVCTGAFAAWKAGLLDGRAATTHYTAVERLRQVATKTTVVEGRRFVDGGKVITTAGVSAGIDGALHLVAARFGRAVADRTARYMEYHWTPEASLAKDYVYLDPSLDERGRALQQAELLEEERSWSAAASAYRAITGVDANDAFAWLGLARALTESGDAAGALAAAQKAAIGPTRGDALFTTARLHARAERRAEALDAIEAAAAAGFGAWWLLERTPELETVRREPRFEAVLARLKAPAGS